MLTGELRNKIDRLWETFWTGGITNPLDVVEQMTYLMFIHDLDEADNTRAKESAMLGLPHDEHILRRGADRRAQGARRAAQVVALPRLPRRADVLRGAGVGVSRSLRACTADKDSAYAKYMGDAIFKIPTPLMLEKIVTAMDESLRADGAAAVPRTCAATYTSTCCPRLRPRA